MMPEMTVRDILLQWLKANGYDGLMNDGAECGCEIGDLIPCDEPCESCRPGYKGLDPSGECDWAIFPTKEAVRKANQRAEDNVFEDFLLEEQHRRPQGHSDAKDD